MLALDSPRWSELRHAYGEASGIPDLIRAIAAEKTSRSNQVSDRTVPTPWDEVYSSLVHQYSTYTATYAAFPHIVEIAENDGVAKRAEALVLAGVIRIKGCAETEIPDDLLRDFDAAMSKVRQSSLATVRTAPLDDRASLASLLQAFAGLRHADSPLVHSLDHFSDGDWELEIDCPTCADFFAIQMTVDGPISQPWYGSDLPIEENTKRVPVDRSNYPTRLKSGRLILQQSTDPDWPQIETANVLAALAEERDAHDLSTRILDTAATIACPLCNAAINLGDELYSPPTLDAE